ncbi:MAG: hypothetical protein Q7S79_02045 [bacterium]|nr:hypothetical protein [bacterium]
MKSLTIHQLDDTTSNLLEKKAEENGASLNKTIKDILRSSLGVDNKASNETFFEEFLGVWTKKDNDSFQKNTKAFERIDSNDWK